MTMIKKALALTLLGSSLVFSSVFADADNFKIIHKRPVETAKETVMFKDLDENLFPDNYYDVEIWTDKSALTFSTDIEDELVLLTWYLVKKDSRFEAIPLSDAMISVDYKKVTGGHQYTVNAPKNISVTDSEGITYNETSPELYGLIAHYFTPLGEDMPDKPEMRIVKFNDLNVVEEPKDEINLVYELSKEYKELQASDFAPPTQALTAEDFAQVFLYMAMADVYEYSVSLPHAKFDKAVSSESKEIIAEGYSLAKGKYPEYMSYYDSYGYTIASAGLGSDIDIRLKNNDFTNEEISTMKTLFNLRTEGYVEELRQAGKLYEGMTDWDKAKVIFEWVVLNTTYDHSKQPVSQTGFGQMDNGTAVCEGYTATYNSMCRSVGIDIQGIVGDAGSTSKEPHIWTLANLDGTRVHIDATWGDPEFDYLPKDYVDYYYFGQSPKNMKPHHEWDESLYGK